MIESLSILLQSTWFLLKPTPVWTFKAVRNQGNKTTKTTLCFIKKRVNQLYLGEYYGEVDCNL